MTEAIGYAKAVFGVFCSHPGPVTVDPNSRLQHSRWFCRLPELFASPNVGKADGEWEW